MPPAQRNQGAGRTIVRLVVDRVQRSAVLLDLIGEPVRDPVRRLLGLPAASTTLIYFSMLVTLPPR